jgi:phosphatidylglycerol:prolipoprotein diacylglycerol transferase
VRPVLYDLWGIPISSFGVFLLIAFFVSVAVARRNAQARLGLDPNWTLDLALYAIIAGIVGGRIGFILSNLGQFVREPASMVTIWRDGGLVFYGALLGALVLVRWYARGAKVSFGALLDAFAPAMILGYAIAMIGALLHGLLAGKPTGVPWAVELFLERRHPAQIYLALAAVAILWILRAQRHQQLAPGTLFALAVFLQSIARFVVDFFVDAPAIAGPLTMGQLASGAAALIAGAYLVVLQRRAPLAEPEAPVEVPA